MDSHFNHERAREMVGKHLIIGLTIHDMFDNVVDHVQLHGNIVRVNPEEGVVVKLLPSGVEHVMPAVLSAYEDAPPGDYQFQSTGEVVSNPDLLTSWVVYEPPEDTEARLEGESSEAEQNGRPGGME